MTRVQKPSGTTHRIREQLNFTDDKRWKQFSSRRLELIDKFKLSERKASEQDENIRQIANILRTEFGYPMAASSEFEKLVTAAVQSVRRNRKRSTKTRSKRSEFSSATSDEEITVSRTTSPVGHIAPSTQLTSMLSSASIQQPSSPQESKFSHVQPSVKALTGMAQVPTGHVPSNDETVLNVSVPIIQPKPIRMIYKSSNSMQQNLNTSNTFKQRYDDFMRSVIKDLTSISINHQKNQNSGSQSNLADFALSSNDFTLLNLALSQEKSSIAHKGSDQNTIPFFLKEKLLQHFHNSKTLIELSNSLSSQDAGNLLKLGQNVINSSISFVLEKFFENLSTSSIEYIHDKLVCSDSLSEFCIKLIGECTKRNLNQLPIEWRIKLLYLLIGGITKDFGFDPCVYPLSEVFHDIILKKYPLVCKDGKSNGGDHLKNAVLMSLPLKPESANKDLNKKVVLRFGDKEQRFVFHLLNHGAPTIREILENSCSLFQFGKERLASLILLYNDEIVKDDQQLEKLLNGFTEEEIILHIKDHSVLACSSGPSAQSHSMNGLQILSSVSQVAAENSISSSPSCITAFDSIISRISSPINQLKKEESASHTSLYPPAIPNNHGKNFANGLPQPVFQPLL